MFERGFYNTQQSAYSRAFRTTDEASTRLVEGKVTKKLKKQCITSIQDAVKRKNYEH